MAVTVTKKIRFSAAHRFELPGLSEAENRTRFGGSYNNHGHNYELEVAVSGEADPDTGMVVNLKDLKDVLHEEVVTPLDFKDLVTDVDFFKKRLPTLENIAQFLWERLDPRIRSLELNLAWLKISENDDLYVEYDGRLVA